MPHRYNEFPYRTMLILFVGALLARRAYRVYEQPQQLANAPVIPATAPAVPANAPAKTLVDLIKERVEELKKDTSYNDHEHADLMLWNLIGSYKGELGPINAPIDGQQNLLELLAEMQFNKSVFALIIKGARPTKYQLSDENWLTRPNAELQAFCMALRYKQQSNGGAEYLNAYIAEGASRLAVQDFVVSAKRTRALFVGGGSEIINTLGQYPKHQAPVPVLAANIIFLAEQPHCYMQDSEFMSMQYDLFVGYSNNQTDAHREWRRPSSRA